MVTSNGKLLIVIKTLLGTAPPWSNVVFEKEVMSHLNMIPQLWGLEFSCEVSSSRHPKKHLCNKGVFPSIILSQLRRPINWAKMFTCLFLYANVEIHQVRILIFDIFSKRVQCLKIYIKTILTWGYRDLELCSHYK